MIFQCNTFKLSGYWLTHQILLARETLETIETLEQGVKFVQLTTKTPGRCLWCCSGVFIVSSEQTSHFSLVALLFTLSMYVFKKNGGMYFWDCRFSRSKDRNIRKLCFEDWYLKDALWIIKFWVIQLQSTTHKIQFWVTWFRCT